MIAFSEILLEEHAESLSPDAKRHLTRIRDNAARMGRLIDHLLAFSRRGEQSLAREESDFAQLWRDA